MKLGITALLTVGCLACAIACGGETSESSRPLDGETNWLRACATDSECGQGICSCGICTTTCVRTGDCSGNKNGATCVPGDSVAAATLCGSTSNTGLCATECESASDCEPGLTCFDGACAADAAIESAPAVPQAGSYVLAVSTGIPGLELFPVIHQVELDAVKASADGTLTAVFRSRPVSACDPTSPLAPFGSFEFRSSGGQPFRADLPEATLPPEANGVTGTQMRSIVAYETESISPDFVCGSVVGELLEPIREQIDGSFTLERVGEHGDVPTPMTIDCRRTEAAVSEFPFCL